MHLKYRFPMSASGPKQAYGEFSTNYLIAHEISSRAKGIAGKKFYLPFNEAALSTAVISF